MSKIRGKHTKPEVRFRMWLVRHGAAGFEMHFGPRKIDFAFPEKRIAIFVDGCFWHGCPKHGSIPKTNRRYWREHIAGNKRRDDIVNEQLRRDGWWVIRLWECTVNALDGGKPVLGHRRPGARPGVGRHEDHLAGGD